MVHERCPLVTATDKKQPRLTPGLLLLYAVLGAGDGIRTLDRLLGKHAGSAKVKAKWQGNIM
jgi:hypothetical protein